MVNFWDLLGCEGDASSYNLKAVISLQCVMICYTIGRLSVWNLHSGLCIELPTRRISL